MLTRRATGRGRRRRTAVAVQEALFEVELRPERRFYRQMLDALARSGFGADALESERVTSRLFGTVWAAQERPRDGSTEEAFGLGLVDYARHRRLPVSVAVLRTVARVAPILQVRATAVVAAGRFADKVSGVVGRVRAHVTATADTRGPRATVWRAEPTMSTCRWEPATGA